MVRFAWLGLSAALALAACSPAAPPAREAEGDAEIASEAAFPDPVLTVRPLYDRYLSETPQFPAFEDAAPWTADLRARIVAMEARAEAAGSPILDFDPLINAQDWDLRNVVVTTDGVAQNSHAVVRARFDNMGRTSEILYDLVWQGGAWRIDNVRESEWDLRQLLAESPG